MFVVGRMFAGPRIFIKDRTRGVLDSFLRDRYKTKRAYTICLVVLTVVPLVSADASRVKRQSPR
jgi:hypothetical protein